jgi:hypothetical protein
MSKMIKIIFDSWDEQLAAAQEPRPDNEPWDSLTSRATEGRYTTQWSGTPNFDEALRLARLGWNEGRARIASGLAAANMANKPLARPTRSYDVAGAFPHMPRAIAGDPCNMVNLGNTAIAARPIVRILIPRFQSSGTSQQTIENWGIAILSHIDAMEDAGYSCELVSGLICKCPYRCHILNLQTTIKRAGEPLELDRLAFAIAHPSSFRRIGFALIERYCPSCFSSNYGTPHRLKPEQVEHGTNYLLGTDMMRQAECSTIENALATVAKQIALDMHEETHSETRA